MDDSLQSTDNKPDSRLQLGMQAFGVEGRQQFGQDVRLAMSSAWKSNLSSSNVLMNSACSTKKTAQQQ